MFRLSCASARWSFVLMAAATIMLASPDRAAAFPCDDYKLAPNNQALAVACAADKAEQRARALGLLTIEKAMRNVKERFESGYGPIMYGPAVIGPYVDAREAIVEARRAFDRAERAAPDDRTRGLAEGWFADNTENLSSVTASLNPPLTMPGFKGDSTQMGVNAFFNLSHWVGNNQSLAVTGGLAKVEQTLDVQRTPAIVALALPGRGRVENDSWVFSAGINWWIPDVSHRDRRLQRGQLQGLYHGPCRLR